MMYTVGVVGKDLVEWRMIAVNNLFIIVYPCASEEPPATLENVAVISWKWKTDSISSTFT